MVINICKPYKGSWMKLYDSLANASTTTPGAPPLAAAHAPTIRQKAHGVAALHGFADQGDDDAVLAPGQGRGSPC